MKSTKTFARVATLLCVIVFASANFAAASPLNNPTGLAIDAKGNLYVANTLSNNILVYSPAYGLEKAKTVSQNIALPTSVAFDPSGNLWVANAGSSNGGANGSIAQYTGTQPTGVVITDSIQSPTAISIDSLGDIWVNNNYGYLTGYGHDLFPIPKPALLRTITQVPQPMIGVVIAGDTIAYGTSTPQDNQGWFYRQSLVDALVYSGLQGGQSVETFTMYPTLVAGAGGGDIYAAYNNGSLLVSQQSGNFYFLNLSLSFTPVGIAVDNVRGRIYISSGFGNSISVYSTVGALLHVIQ